MENVLETAARVTSQEREKDYGPVEVHHAKVAAMLNVIFGDRLAPGRQFEAGDVSMIHFCEKIVRESNAPKRDNLVDLAGYARMRERIIWGVK